MATVQLVPLANVHQKKTKTKMKLFVLLSVVALASCVPVAQEDSVMKSVIGNFMDCMNSDLNMCLKVISVLMGRFSELH